MTLSNCCSPNPMPTSDDAAADVKMVNDILAIPVLRELLSRIDAVDGCINKYFERDTRAEIEKLQSLRAVGLIQGVIEGATPCFCLNRDTLFKVLGRKSIEG